jgi:hypothetical protein
VEGSSDTIARSPSVDAAIARLAMAMAMLSLMSFSSPRGPPWWS